MLNAGDLENPAPLPASVVSNRVKALGNVSGAVTLNFAEGNIFTMTLTGSTTVENLTNCLPSGQRTEAVLVVLAEGHELKFNPSVFGALQPEVNPEAGYATQIPIVTENGGASFLPTPNRGETGPEPFEFLGAWVSKGTYAAKAPAAVILEANALWLCTAPVTGSTTPPKEDALHWRKLLEGPKGEKGEPGLRGIEGPAGAQAKIKALGEQSGTVEINVKKLWEEGFQGISALWVGPTKLKIATGAGTFPEGVSFTFEIWSEMDATGHPLELPGLIWPEGVEPEANTSPRAYNNYVVNSQNGGATVFASAAPKKGAQGEPGLTPMGVYNKEATYQKGNVVSTKSGGLYAAKGEVKNVEPPNVEHWELLIPLVGEWTKFNEVSTKLVQEAESSEPGFRSELGANLRIRADWEAHEEVGKGATLGVLPEGLRPSKEKRRTATITSAGNEKPTVVGLMIQTNGKIILTEKVLAGKFIHFETDFSLT